jgi:ABC-2 type transport system permease protein
MPAPLRVFADHQPMTAIINAIRDALLGHVNASQTLLAGAWLAGLTLAFAALIWAGGRLIAARPL